MWPDRVSNLRLTSQVHYKSKPGKKSTGSTKVHYKYQKIIQTLHKTLTGIRASYSYLDYNRTRAYCAYSRCGLVGLDICYSTFFSLSPKDGLI